VIVPVADVASITAASSVKEVKISWRMAASDDKKKHSKRLSLEQLGE
jgi:hypothetical protein